MRCGTGRSLTYADFHILWTTISGVQGLSAGWLPRQWRGSVLKRRTGAARPSKGGGMAAHGLVVSDVLAAWASGDFEAFAQALAPDVQLLGHDPGSGGCRNRQEVLTLLRQRHARGRTTGVI